MLKTLFSNPVTRTFIALIIAVISVLGAFFTYVTAPKDFGNTSVQFDIDTVYYFADDWSVAYDYAKISFSPGTLVIPGYHQGRVVAVLLIPPEDHPGAVSLSFPQEFRGELPETIEDNLEQALILLDYADYTKILQDSGDTILLRADEITQADVPHQYLKRQLEHGYSLLTSYDIFGYNNWLLPTSQTVLLRLWGSRLGMLTYYEDARVKVTAPDFSLNFAHPQLEKQYYPPASYHVRALVYMAFLTLTAASLIAFIAGGLEIKEKEIKGQYDIYRTIAVLLGTMLYAAALSAFEQFFQPSPYATAALWALPLVGAIIWSRKARLEPSFFGITTHGLAAGFIAAVSVCILIALGSAFSLPVGFKFDSVLIPLAAAIILREALLRGFCQRIISHWLHPLAGLLIVSCAWALIAVFTGPAPVGALALASALCQSLVVGYLYYCSKNLFAPCLLAALLELAPMVLQF